MSTNTTTPGAESVTSGISPFSFEGQPVRIVDCDNGEPLFNANDVCSALELANPRDAIAKHVDSDDVAKRDIIDSMGRTQQASFINESGLYALIFGSTKESAKRFKRWVTSEVLPSIRKTGSYTAPNHEQVDGVHISGPGMSAALNLATMFKKLSDAGMKSAPAFKVADQATHHDTGISFMNAVLEPLPAAVPEAIPEKPARPIIKRKRIVPKLAAKPKPEGYLTVDELAKYHGLREEAVNILLLGRRYQLVAGGGRYEITTKGKKFGMAHNGELLWRTTAIS